MRFKILVKATQDSEAGAPEEKSREEAIEWIRRFPNPAQSFLWEWASQDCFVCAASARERIATDRSRSHRLALH